MTEAIHIKYFYFKYTITIISLLGLLINLTSCSTIDYINYTNIPHGTKTINKSQISLITYNIKAIYEKDEIQVDKLMEHINAEEYDFVIFQELFDESTRDQIIEKANVDQYSTFIARVDYNSFPEFIFQDAGLFMMSSHPRTDLSDIDFGDGIKNSNGIIHMLLEKEMSKTNDFLANKSVMGALFEVDNKTRLFLFTTHVQAIGSTEHKELQLTQIKFFIDSAVNAVLESKFVSSTQNLVVVLAGDFNSNAYDGERFRRMQNLLGFSRDLHKDFHGTKQEHTFRFGSNNASRRFDYILAYDSLGASRFKHIEVESIGTIDIKDDAGNSISDHLGLKASLKID